MAIALYARKSVERENSISCETQIEYCKSMIKPDERAEETLIFIDNGFSGGNTEREGFREMMRRVESGTVSKIIVYRLDRISRSLSDFVRILETLKRFNVRFVSSQESFDTSSPYGEMIVKILMVFAEFERQSIIERVTQAYAHRSEMGLYMGGRLPYGFTLKDTVIHNIRTKMYAPVPNEAEQIKYIFEAYSSGNMSLKRLADRLAENGITPTRGSWSAAKLSAILKNPIYVKADNAVYEYLAAHNANIVSGAEEFDGTRGVQLYGKTGHGADDWSDIKAVVMTHEGIVSSELWLRCRKKLEKNRRTGRAVSNSTSWLGGIIVCGQCGGTMTVTRGGARRDGTRTRYFNCARKLRGGVCKGQKAPLYADSMEGMVFDLIYDKLKTLNACPRRAKDGSNAINALKNRLSAIKSAQDKLVDMLMNGEIGDDILSLLNERARRLSEERRGIAEKIEKLENAKTETVNLSKRWRGADYEQKRAVCGVLIHKIYIREDGVCEVVWNI